MTEREKYIEHRLKHLRKMIAELEAEREEIQGRRMDAYLDHLERGCNPSMELAK